MKIEANIDQWRIEKDVCGSSAVIGAARLSCAEDGKHAQHVASS
jgi:hypothetical protein